MHILFYILLAAAPQWELSTSISYIYNVTSDGDNGIWCASSGGVFHYSGEEGVGTVFSCPDDLPTPDCRDILFDSDNRLWIATGSKYLVMKDGDIWANYSNFEGIPGLGRVNALAESGGSVWVGCDGGLAGGDENGFIPISGDIFSPDDVYSLAQRNDTLWICSSRGIYSLLTDSLHDPFHPDSWTHWPETQGLQLNRITTGLHSVYACGASGAMELSSSSDSFQFIIDYSSLPDSAIVDVRETSRGLLAAGHGVVFIRDGENWAEYGDGLPFLYWPVTIFEMDDHVYCSFTFVTNVGDLTNTQTGLGFYTLLEDDWEHVQIPGMQCKKTHQMISCQDGRIYAGTYSRGVQAYYPGYGWRSFVEENGMPNSSQTFSVAADPANGIWASSYHHGLSWIRDNNSFDSQGDTVLTFIKDSLICPWATLIYEDSIPNNQVVMLINQSGGMWAAFRQFDPAGNPDEPSGILGFNGDPMGTMNWAPRLGNEGIASMNVRAVYPASQDSLWIAFETGAGCQLLVHSGDPSDSSEDSWYPGFGTAYTTSHGLPSNEVFCFVDVPGVGFLAGTAEGLARWTGSDFSPYMNITGQIKTMSVDSRGRVWCLAESGIYRISDGQVSFFNDINSDFVPSAPYQWEYSLTDAVNGGVFFSSEQGLWLVTQDGNTAPSGNEVSFYPQPFISGEDQLRVCGPDDSSAISVDFFRLDGSHAGTVDAMSVSNWAWDGTLDGNIVASGVYMVLVTINNTVYQTRISVVR